MWFWFLTLTLSARLFAPCTISPSVHPSLVEHLDIGGVVHLGRRHAHCVRAFGVGAEGKHVLREVGGVDGLVESVETGLERDGDTVVETTNAV